MKLIIDIPNKIYQRLKDDDWVCGDVPVFIECVKHGAVLSEPQEDDRAISVNAAIKAVRHAEVNFSVQSEIDFTKHKREVHEIINNILDAQEKALRELLPVTPRRPTGQWIWIDDEKYSNFPYYGCSICHSEAGFLKESQEVIFSDYCPNCGAKMVESQERSE